MPRSKKTKKSSKKTSKRSKRSSKPKTSKKTRTSRKGKALQSAKPEHYFILATGVPVKNLKELADALGNMNEWVFSHHVNEHRNDFATWIKDVLEEEGLAEEIRQLNRIHDVEMRILRHLVTKYVR